MKDETQKQIIISFIINYSTHENQILNQILEGNSIWYSEEYKITNYHLCESSKYCITINIISFILDLFLPYVGANIFYQWESRVWKM